MRLDCDSFAQACVDLADLDPHLRAVVERRGIPPFWHRPPGFATLVLFIVEQQVSLASAKAVFDRVRELVGAVTPARLLAAGPHELRACGLTRQKSRYVLELAVGVEAGTFDVAGLEHVGEAEARERLLAATGIGPWTADVYLLSSLRHPDVWPVGDRALQVGTAEVIGMPQAPGPEQLGEIGERWRPHRSVAARLVWHEYLTRRNRSETEVSGLGSGP